MRTLPLRVGCEVGKKLQGLLLERIVVLILAGWAVVHLLCIQGAVRAAETARAPNVLFILTDDKD